MKITDSQVIREGEKELINSVKKQIDQEKIRELIAQKLSGGNLEARGGEIVIHNQQIAFRLDFEMQFTGSILLDREGNLLSNEVAAESHTRMDDEEPLQEGDEHEALMSDSDSMAEEKSADSDDENNDADHMEEEESFMAGEDIDIDFTQVPLEGTSSDNSDNHEEDLAEIDEDDDNMEMEEIEEDLPDSELLELTEDDSMEYDSIKEVLLDSDFEEEEDDQSFPDDILMDDAKKEGTDFQEDIIDENINEILEESRAFWKENKKS